MGSSKRYQDKAMRIIWESEGHKWDDLFEYPYNDSERAAILVRLRAAAVELENLFRDELV